MCIRILIALAAACLAATAMAQTEKTVTSPDGTLILRPFQNAAYPHKSRENGYITQGKTYSAAEHYSDSTVGIFIPSGFRPGKSTDFVVHFHGHLNHVEQVFQQFNLGHEIVKSGVNAILLVPQGPKDVPDSGDGHLELDAGAFEALVREAAHYLKGAGRIASETIGHVAITAHSGGYEVVSAILHHGGLSDNITDVCLLDASYGGLESFADWAKGGHGRRLISIFTEHLASANVELMALMQERGVRFRVMLEPTARGAALKPRGALFVHTLDLAHNDVVAKNDTLADYLASSSLRKR
ncbi:MAG TPA: hypothetical protein VGM37_04790 [Armatimonadota bacterium]|jgi:hypothetical protein